MFLLLLLMLLLSLLLSLLLRLLRRCRPQGWARRLPLRVAISGAFFGIRRSLEGLLPRGDGLDLGVWWQWFVECDEDDRQLLVYLYVIVDPVRPLLRLIQWGWLFFWHSQQYYQLLQVVVKVC